jgi:hypothetical protein
MADKDLNFKSGGAFDTVGKPPYFRVADLATGYLKNSLEGTLFDSLPTGTSALDFKFLDNVVPTNVAEITAVSRTDNVLSLTVIDNSHGITTANSLGKYVSINDTVLTLSSNNVNGVFKLLTAEPTLITVGQTGVDFTLNSLDTNGTLRLLNGHSLKISDYRTETSPGSATDKSYCSFLLSPQGLVDFDIASSNRVVPSDMYVRFRITSSDGKGGIHPDVFNVKVGTDLSKPILWAWFFGGSYKSSGQTAFQTIFNSYALVLRPSGLGTNLEFALLKFNYLDITSGSWSTDVIDKNKIKRYNTPVTTSGATVDLGYLIATNSNIKDSEIPVCTEIAKSNDFFYDSSVEFKANLKFSVKKHILSDGNTTSSYLVQLAKNENYDFFGESYRYSSILHSFINIPSGTPSTPKIVSTDPTDYRLLPAMYFKYINLVQSDFGASASSIFLDNFLYRQANSNLYAIYRRY